MVPSKSLVALLLCCFAAPCTAVWGVESSLRHHKLNKHRHSHLSLRGHKHNNAFGWREGETSRLKDLGAVANDSAAAAPTAASAQSMHFVFSTGCNAYVLRLRPPMSCSANATCCCCTGMLGTSTGSRKC